MSRLVISDLEQAKFWSKVDKSADCWLYHGLKMRNGYGRVYLASLRDKALAHRLSWEIANDRAVPEGKIITHSCDVRNCVNPSHLRPGTYADNTREMFERGRGKSWFWTEEFRSRGQRGSFAPNNKFTEEAVRFIKVALRAGVTQRQLANAYSVSASSVGRIARGETWTMPR